MPTIPHTHFIYLSIARGNQLREHYVPDPTEWPPEELGFTSLSPGHLLFLPTANASSFSFNVYDARGHLLRNIASPTFTTLTVIEWFADENFPIRNALDADLKGTLGKDDEVGRLLGLVMPGRGGAQAGGVDLSDLMG